MKTILSLLCWLCVVVMLTGCDNGDDGGTTGARGDWPDVSFAIDENTERVTCFNADKNVITTEQVCTWNCAFYQNTNTPAKVTLYFEPVLVCTETATSTTDPETGEETVTVTEDCQTEIGLNDHRTRWEPCELKN